MGLETVVKCSVNSPVVIREGREGKSKGTREPPPWKNYCYGFIAKYLCVQVDQEAPLIWPFVDTYSSLLDDVVGPRNNNHISFTLPAYLIKLMYTVSQKITWCRIFEIISSAVNRF